MLLLDENIFTQALDCGKVTLVNRRNYKMAKNGKAPKSKPVDTDRETRVLLEDMNRNITRIAEAQSSTAEQIAEIKASMATKSELNIVSMAVMSLSGDVKTLRGDVKTLSGDVKTLSGDVKTLQDDVKKLDTKVDAIDTRLKTVENKIDENLTNHDKRITKLEEKVLA